MTKGFQRMSDTFTTPSTEALVLSSLAKVRLDGPGEGDQPLPEPATAWIFRGSSYSFQLALKLAEPGVNYLTLEHDTLPDGVTMSVRRVGQIPVELAAYPDRHDDNYLSVEPGIYPDVLQDADPELLSVRGQAWESYWIELSVSEDAAHYDGALSFVLKRAHFPLTVSNDGVISMTDSEPVLTHTLNLQVAEQALPEQKLLQTTWFHADSLADHYDLETWSEEHWEVTRQFVRVAKRRGMNMILTPVFTPPLDTGIGTYRTNVQLTDVTRKKDGSWTFGFERLERWIKMCLEEGMTAFEISHLFSQWGANACPQIRGEDKTGELGITEAKGSERGFKSPRSRSRLDELPLLFGWHTSSTSEAYAEFLKSFLPELMKVLDRLGVKDASYFHVSDEPHAGHLETYQACKALIEPYIEGRPIMDALSNIEFFSQGVTEYPIPANDHIAPFLEAEVPDLWTYYCCGQAVDVSNRFLSMPSYRNRIIGVQMYVGKIVGFLHWGFNFYYTQYSAAPVNPYLTADSGGSFPAGDPFVVYPGADGKPEESLRWVVFGEALEDLRLLQGLEAQAGRDAVLDLIRETAAETGASEEEQKIGFATYPQGEAFLLQLREKVSARLVAGAHAGG